MDIKMQFPIELFSAGTVIYIDFPFEEDKTKTKNRPAVIVDFDDDETKVILLKVTSQDRNGAYDVPLEEPEFASLKSGSVVRCDHVLRVPNGYKCEKSGDLSRKDLLVVTAVYRMAISNNAVSSIDK